MLSRRLQVITRNTYFSVELRILLTSRPVTLLQTKDKLSMDLSSYWVYQFTCTCGTSHVGRTTRRLSERTKEHHPSWLNKRAIKNRQMEITIHLIELDNQLSTSGAFRPVYVVRRRLTENVKSEILSTPKAIMIHLNNSPLSAQKQPVRPFSPPWSSAPGRIRQSMTQWNRYNNCQHTLPITRTITQ